MLRAVFVGLLCVSAVACKSESDAPKSQPGVAAGKVIEVTGAVTVRHGDVARPLAVGQTVEGDDVIETGGDGRVVIELVHNNAKWELGANKKQVVKESIAWKLAKNEGTAKPVDQETAAAGRPAERSAAGNSATASESAPIQQEPSAAAQPSAEPPPPPPAPAATTTTKKRGSAPPSPPKAKPTVDSAAPSGGGGSTERRKETTSALADSDAEGPSAHDLISKQTNAIRTCLSKDMPEVDLVIAISAAGTPKITISASTPVPAKVKTCVNAAIQKIKFAKQAQTVKVKVSR